MNHYQHNDTEMKDKHNDTEMKKTLGAAPFAEELRLAEAALQDAVERENVAAANERQAGLNAELARERKAPGGPDLVNAYNNALVEYDQALSEMKKAKLNREGAEADLSALRRRIEVAGRQPVVAAVPSDADRAEAFELDLLAADQAAKQRSEAEKAVDAIRQELAAIDGEHQAALKNRGPIAEQGRILTEITGRREALNTRLPEAEQALATAREVEAGVMGRVVGHLNVESAKLIDGVREVVQSLRAAVAKPPVLDAASKLVLAREGLMHARDAKHQVELGRQYLELYQENLSAITRDIESLRVLAHEITLKVGRQGA